MKKDIQKKLIKMIRSMTKTKLADSKILDMAYLDEGLIDSFQLVEMISTLEQQFSTKFSAADLTSTQFRTLEGVSEIIERDMQGKKVK